jgi:hypothetical protein
MISPQEIGAAVAERVTLTETEIETLGSQQADAWSKDEWQTEETDQLYDANLDAVLTRAEAIAFDRNATEHLDSVESLLHLAHATGCPESEPIVPWLQERGLTEEVDGGWRFKSPKPGVVAAGE